MTDGMIIPLPDGLDLVGSALIACNPENGEYTMRFWPAAGLNPDPAAVARALRILATGIEAEAVAKGERVWD